MTDWVRWHTGYDEPDSPYARRLAVVQQQIGVALDRAAPGRIAVLSLCAGQGRDVLPVLAEHPRGGDVGGRLIELDPPLCATARAAAPPGVEVVQGDAGRAAAYVGAVPADLLLLCGIFGNVSDADIAATIGVVPGTAEARWDGRVDPAHRQARHHPEGPGRGSPRPVWPRQPSSPATDTGPRWAVGAGTLQARSAPLGPDRRLFTFFR